MPRKPMQEESPPMTAAEWEAQTPCKSCGSRAGYNPATGLHVKFWDPPTRTYIEGHRAGCLTLAKKQ